MYYALIILLGGHFRIKIPQKLMDAESRVSNLERLNKDLTRQIAEVQDQLDNETRDKHTLMAKMR